MVPNKGDLLNHIHSAKIFSKFDLKSGYWRIQIHGKDRYKTTFTIPFGHFKWNVMPFGLKNAPLKFQNIMNNSFNPYTKLILSYMGDILIFSQSIYPTFETGRNILTFDYKKWVSHICSKK